MRRFTSGFAVRADELDAKLDLLKSGRSMEEWRSKKKGTEGEVVPVVAGAKTVGQHRASGIVEQLQGRLERESVGQVVDPQVLFNAVYEDLKRERGGEDLVLPKECIWLVGAPGSGKGTHAQAIMSARGITQPPIIMSNLLVSQTSAEAKSQGKLVADAYVASTLLRELADPKYDGGAIVDGFPRNLVQSSFVFLLHSKMKSLREQVCVCMYYVICVL